jgi:UDP-N-acetylmuramyl pentapeptide phosphotransferase/UDP-N-acetylglucosamine-1-phosphate transferase
MPHAVFYTVWCLTAVFGSAVLTRQLIDWARARGMLDLPNERGSHALPTPRGGGLAIVAVVSAAVCLAAVLHPESLGPLAGAMLPALAVAAVSWFDDQQPVPIRVRFAVHFAAAVAATAVLGPVERIDLGSFGAIDLGVAAWPLTVLWIVGLINAFNFMDGIDGIAGITALAGGIAIAAAAWVSGATAIGAVAAAFAAASLGFLMWNWPPARVFMGDVGSTFCGMLLAVLPLAVGAEAKPRVVPVAVFVMWPFIFDTAYTIVRRLRNRENVFQPHRSHLYQRLTIAGWSHRAVSGLYGALAAMAAVIGVAPLFDPSLRQSADHAALWTIGIGIILLLALRK